MQDLSSPIICATRELPGPSTARPAVLILTSGTLFPEFFPDPVRAALTDTCFWELRSDREDTPRLRDAIAVSDAIITTWLSPFLHAAMGTATRLKLVAYCGGSAEPPGTTGRAAVEAVTRYFRSGTLANAVSFEMLARIT